MPETRRAVAERIVKPHKFEPGRWLFGQRLCALCYKQFYHACHSPSFAQTEARKAIRNEES